MFPNRYKGNCYYCGTFLSKGEGFYEYGRTLCTDTISVRDGMTSRLFCLASYNKTFSATFATPNEAQAHETDKEQKEVERYKAKLLSELINGGLVELAQRANVRSLAQVIHKIVGADIAISDLSFTQAVNVRNELHARINRKESAKIRGTFQKSNTCRRCGGAGRSDRWALTGYTCYQCGGSGKYYNN